jgi:hypothetical protein
MDFTHLGAERLPGLARCAVCRSGLTREQGRLSCAACLARHHSACWEVSGGCGHCQASRFLLRAAQPAPVALLRRLAARLNRLLP